MSRAQVRQSLAVGFDEFKKSSWDKVMADDFRDANAHAFYSSDGVVVGFEVFKPSEFYYREASLLGVGISDLTAALDAAGVAYEEDELGLTLRGGDIALYAPGKDSEINYLVKSVYVEF